MDGLMQPAGLAVVAAAKASGTWTSLDEAETLDEPGDLAAALDAVAAAAKTDEARTGRIARTVSGAAVNTRAINGASQPVTSEKGTNAKPRTDAEPRTDQRDGGA